VHRYRPGGMKEGVGSPPPTSHSKQSCPQLIGGKDLVHEPTAVAVERRCTRGLGGARYPRCDVAF
jgi:hypothetical protein